MGKVTNFAHFIYVKINFSAKSQQKNYSTENKVIGAKNDNIFHFPLLTILFLKCIIVA